MFVPVVAAAEVAAVQSSSSSGSCRGSGSGRNSGRSTSRTVGAGGAVARLRGEQEKEEGAGGRRVAEAAIRAGLRY